MTALWRPSLIRLRQQWVDCWYSQFPWQLMLLLGELKDIRPAISRPRLVIKHVPDRSFYARDHVRLGMGPEWRRSARIGIAQAEKQNPGAWPGLCVRSERAAQEALRGLRASPTPARPRPSSESVAGSGTSEGYVDIVDKQCAYSTYTSKLSG